MDESRRQRILRQHVDTDRLLGVDAVPLGEAPEGDVVDKAEQSGTSSTDEVSGDAARTTPATPATPTAASASPSSFTPSASRVDLNSSSASNSSAKGDSLYGGDSSGDSSAYVPARPAYHPIDADQKVALLDALNRNEVMGCEKCELCRARTQTVFGEGDPDANLMFVGEGPGRNEDEQGRPFCGRSGEKLDGMIKAMGLSREKVFIANVVKCRPPNNRAPTPVEADA